MYFECERCTMTMMARSTEVKLRERAAVKVKTFGSVFTSVLRVLT